MNVPAKSEFESLLAREIEASIREAARTAMAGGFILGALVASALYWVFG